MQNQRPDTETEDRYGVGVEIGRIEVKDRKLFVIYETVVAAQPDDAFLVTEEQRGEAPQILVVVPHLCAAVQSIAIAMMAERVLDPSAADVAKLAAMPTGKVQ